MKMIIVIVAAVISCIVVVGWVLMRNQANLTLPPGPMKRITLFLTTNVAEIKPGPVLPELLSPNFDEPAHTLCQRAVKQAEKLGWRIVEHNPDQHEFTAVVTTNLMQFKDDVVVKAMPITANSSYILARSQSRIGRGDLASNSHHLQLLLSSLKNQQ